jgi:hypothetical protein
MRMTPASTAKLREPRLHEIERDVAALRESHRDAGLARRSVRARSAERAFDDRRLLEDVGAPRPRAVRLLLDRLGTDEPTLLARAAAEPGAAVRGAAMHAVQVDDAERTRLGLHRRRVRGPSGSNGRGAIDERAREEHRDDHANEEATTKTPEERRHDTTNCSARTAAKSGASRAFSRSTRA